MRHWWLVSVALLSACDGGRKPDDVLCPSCVPLSGGETSDFGGGSECELEARAIPDEPELMAELEATLAAYSGPFQRKLRWSSPVGLTPATGDETEIRGDIVFGDGRYFVGESAACGEFVQVSARIAFETADGAVRATSDGALTLERAVGRSEVVAVTDLSQVRGTLDLRIDSAEPHVGRLLTQMTNRAEGRSGSVTIEVSYFADLESAEANARGGLAASISDSRVVGTF